MKGPFEHPTVEAVEDIHAQVLESHGGSTGIRDRALLESAVAAPQATMSGVPILTDPVDIAAGYLFHICQNHPFVDGNKRTGLATALVFLSENNLLPNEELRVDDWVALTLAVAAGELDRSEIAARMRRLLT